ncbi:hypothetical protein L6452_08328 [Arctium lappa]|uniref:Uncharacterized protein n=1 Tax=Arctium lappa TaxID=4217 RepID=A0ACB9DI24_ARCLA|nr:hypothetical protein L6452_08328 [Arctium lappa]
MYQSDRGPVDEFICFKISYHPPHCTAWDLGVAATKELFLNKIVDHELFKLLFAFIIIYNMKEILKRDPSIILIAAPTILHANNV